MHEEIQKLIDGGKLTKTEGAALDKLKPGTSCLHKGWGFGQVNAWNLPMNQISIDFKGRPAHPMQLKYAATTVQSVDEGHILSLLHQDPAKARRMAAENPLDLVRQALASNGGRMSGDQLAAVFIGTLMNETEFKKWWDVVKKQLKKDANFEVPVRKTDPILLRSKPLSRPQELLAVFKTARQSKAILKAADEIVRNLGEFETEPDLLREVVSGLLVSGQVSFRSSPSQALEMLLEASDIAARYPDSVGTVQPVTAMADLLRQYEGGLADLVSGLSATWQRPALEAFEQAFGEVWLDRLVEILPHVSARVVGEIAKALEKNGQKERLEMFLIRSLQSNSANSEMLYWLCRERKGAWGHLADATLLRAILASKELDQLSEYKKGTRLYNLLMEDQDLVPDLIQNAEKQVVRDIVRRIISSIAFEELDKRSILGRIMRIYPDLQSMLTGDQGERDQAIVVSWDSLAKKQEEYEEMIKKKIPDNTREISVARSYGDLRENFEYKAAKDMQRVLMRRKAELEQMLASAKGTDFNDADTSVVSIGTVVEILDEKSGRTETYKILGAWDSDPVNGVIAYLTAIGQGLLGRKIGEKASLPTETGFRNVIVQSIKPYVTAP